MKIELKPSDREVMAGLVERVTYHNADTRAEQSVVTTPLPRRRTFITRAARLWQMPRGLAGRRIDEPQLRNAAVVATIGPIVPLGDLLARS